MNITITLRQILRIVITLVAICLLALFKLNASQPNIIVIFADDLGYGDLSCFGHPTLATPELDQMAREGQKWTNFYAAAPICSPSRAGLLTGRYPVRSGTSGSVFFEWSASGLDPEEVTIAEVLKQAGYATGMVGKWHLGHLPQFLPTRQGFDSYYGIPYSNDMRVDPQMPVADNVRFREDMSLEKMRDGEQKVNGWVPLFENEKVIEYPCDQETLTRRYTKRCIDFIRENREGPFFLYYAQTFPHVPLFASDAFRDTSMRGLYGDVVEELDASVGAILLTLKELEIDQDTLVVFTSDNGPWASKLQEGGSAGLLRGAKGQTWDGGMREPTIFWWPGKIAPGTVRRDLGSTLDFMVTFANLAGAEVPTDRPLDSYDLTGKIIDDWTAGRQEFFYYRDSTIYAIRQGMWKAHFIIQGSYGQGEKKTVLQQPQLYHLGHDPGEQYDLAADHPEIVEKMLVLKANQEASLIPAPSRYVHKIESQQRPNWAK